MENSEEIDLLRVGWVLFSQHCLTVEHVDLFKKLKPVLIFYYLKQTLLQNNITASYFSAQLSGTQWSVQDLSSFLSKQSEDTRPPGTAFTWRNVFNETDQAILSISRFMEVRNFVLS